MHLQVFKSCLKLLKFWACWRVWDKAGCPSETQPATVLRLLSPSWRSRWRWELYFHGEPIMTHYPISLVSGERRCVRVYFVDTARVSLIYLDSRWLFLFGIPVHYRFQLFSKWQNKLYWSDLSSPAICATAKSDNAEYFGPPGVKNYTYFSLDEKRPHLNHQSLLTRGWLSRINFGIFLPLGANGCWPTPHNGFQRFQPLVRLM